MNFFEGFLSTVRQKQRWLCLNPVPGAYCLYAHDNQIALLLATVLFALGPTEDLPQYTSDWQMQRPDHYREWVYLTSGFDMNYNPSMQMGDDHVFDNVFVNPDAYRAFVKPGTWPDHTILVLEVRAARGKGSMNQAGNYQGLLPLRST
jgi:hypothetical protein